MLLAHGSLSPINFGRVSTRCAGVEIHDEVQRPGGATDTIVVSGPRTSH
jgi:hypothetical protein